MSKSWKEIEKGLKAFFEEKDVIWRIQSCGGQEPKIWALVMPYIDGRAVMDRLDEVVGMGNWKDKYVFSNDKKSVTCELSIKCGDEWVTKMDGADVTDIEPTKGGISASLKRAAVKFGIGRYLYDMDIEFVNQCTGSQAKKGKCRGRTKSKVSFTCNPPKIKDKFLPQKGVAKAPEKKPEYKTQKDPIFSPITENEVRKWRAESNKVGIKSSNNTDKEWLFFVRGYDTEEKLHVKNISKSTLKADLDIFSRGTKEVQSILKYCKFLHGCGFDTLNSKIELLSKNRFNSINKLPLDFMIEDIKNYSETLATNLSKEEVDKEMERLFNTQIKFK